jgi:hypothetical protein
MKLIFSPQSRRGFRDIPDIDVDTNIDFGAVVLSKEQPSWKNRWWCRWRRGFPTSTTRFPHFLFPEIQIGGCIHGFHRVLILKSS